MLKYEKSMKIQGVMFWIITLLASFAPKALLYMRHLAINIITYRMSNIQEAAMKRSFLLAIGFLILGANVALAAVCPDIQYLNKFKISQDGAEVARVAAGSDRKVYVADVNGGFLKVYYSDGKFVESKKFENLSTVGIEGSAVFVGKARKQRGAYVGEVRVLNSSLQYQFSLGSGSGEFRYPVAIVSNGSRIFVADRILQNIKAFDATNGAYLFSFGGNGYTSTDTPAPSGLAIHPSTGNIYVSDRAYDLDSNFTYGLGAGVHVFSAVDGSYISQFAIDYGFDNLPGEMEVPSGIAIDSTGRVYVTDSGSGTVEVFDSAGNFVCDVASTNGTVYQISPAFTTDGKFVFSSVGGLRTYSTEQYVEMDVSPSSLTFTAQDCAPDPDSQSLTVSNIGQGTMNWTASSDQSWLTIDSSFGTVSGIGSSVINVSVDKTSLGAGTHTGILTITSEAGTAQVVVTLDIFAAPSLDVTQDGAPYDFLVNGDNIQASKTVTININNDQTDLVTWSASLSETWMSLAPTSGPSGTNTIGAIGINSGALSGLTSGNYAGNITISAGCVSITDVVIPVNLTYYGGGTIDVTTNVAGAAYTITGPQIFNGSGTASTFFDAAAGTYTITYDPVVGYLVPDQANLTLSGQDTIAFNGVYTDIRKDNNIIVTMGGATKWNVNDEGKVFDDDGTPLDSFMIKKVKNPSRGGKEITAGGTITASGDIDGDGIDDIVVADKDGVIKVYSGSGALLPGSKFMAFKGSAKIDIAVGDLDGDGSDEIIATSGTERGDDSLIRAFSYSSGSISDTGLYFRAYAERLGANIATGDVDGDGVDEILTTRAGSGGRDIYIRIWKVDSTQQTWTITASGAISAGVSFLPADIAAGDVDADGTDEIIVTRLLSSSDTASMITAYEADGTQVLNFAGPAKGVVIASGDIDMDGAAEVVVAEGPSRLSSTTITIYNADGSYRSDFKAYNNANIFGATVTLGQTTSQ
jgi:hypothetical protein